MSDQIADPQHDVAMHGVAEKWLADLRNDYNAYRRSHAHEGTFACCSAHAVADRVPTLVAALDAIRGALAAYVERESADAAAGSYAGRAEEAEAARDAVQAEATLLRRALIGRRHFPAGVMRTPMDERTEAIRARWDEFCFSGPSETDRERDQVIGWLLDRMDSATARAERAEAALAEMRETLAAQLDGVGDRVANSEAAQGAEQDAVIARAQAGTYHVAAWMLRNPDATWSTALERAADEQGNGEGGGA